MKTRRKKRTRRGGMMKSIKHAFGFFTPPKNHIDARNAYLKKKYESSTNKGPFCVVDQTGKPEYNAPDKEPIIFTDPYGNEYYIGNSVSPRKRADECITPDNDEWLNLYELPDDVHYFLNPDMKEKLYNYKRTIQDLERRYIEGEHNQLFEPTKYEDPIFKENYERYKKQLHPEHLLKKQRQLVSSILTRKKRDRSQLEESKNTRPNLKRERTEDIHADGTLSYSPDIDQERPFLREKSDEHMPSRDVTLEEQERNEMGKADNESRIVQLDYIAEGTSKFLKAVCSDSGVCITFGKELEKIKEFFGNFDLRYITEPVKRIGAPSNNGFIHEITFTNKGYSAHAVLKSSKNTTRSGNIPDNLMYEYRVGLFLNKMALRYPCFLETYNLYAYNSVMNHSYVEQTEIINAEDFKRVVIPRAYDLTYACILPTQTCILIQHLRDCFPSHEFVMRGHANLNYDFLPILYQVYYVLNAMRSTFTHYDLHSSNVLLYEPSPDKYVEYHYHHASGIRSFKSIYVVKIIDYGRCYFNDTDEHISSLNIKASLCSKGACRPNCGYRKGFGWLSNDDDRNYINSSIPNSSHDLKFARNLLALILHVRYDSSHMDPRLLDILRDMYTNMIYTTPYGTAEMNDCPLKICNVSTMFMKLESIFGTMDLDGEFNRFYSNRTKLGDMHVYGNRPLEFIEVPTS
jgi:hypothetical protein